MLPSFCRDTATIWRAPLIEERGTTVRDWDNAVPHIERKCSFQPGGGSTSWATHENERIVNATLFLQPNADIQLNDRVFVQGRTFSVDSVDTWQSPTGRVSHVQAALIDWEG